MIRSANLHKKKENREKYYSFLPYKKGEQQKHNKKFVYLLFFLFFCIYFPITEVTLSKIFHLIAKFCKKYTKTKNIFLMRKSISWALLLLFFLLAVPASALAKNDIEKEVKEMVKSLKKEGWKANGTDQSLEACCRTYMMHRDAIDEATGMPRYIIARVTVQDKKHDVAVKKAAMRAKADIMVQLKASVKGETITMLKNGGEEVIKTGSIQSDIEVNAKRIMEFCREQDGQVKVMTFMEYDMTNIRL